MDELAQALEMLRECRSVIVEHAFDMEGGSEVTSWGCCVVCGSADWRGHKPNCELDRFVKKVDAFLDRPKVSPSGST